MEKVEKLYALQEQILKDLEGVNAPAAKLLIDNFRSKVQELGIEVSDLPIPGMACTTAGGTEWSAFIQSVADKRSPKVHIEFESHPGGWEYNSSSKF